MVQAVSKASPAKKLGNYLGECIRILYWAYFKPFTFNKWLGDIHPELDFRTNPFKFQAEFPTNPRLYRYAGQVWWLAATVPLLVTLIVAPIYSLTTGESFDWFSSTLVLLGWLIGLLLARGDNE